MLLRVCLMIKSDYETKPIYSNKGKVVAVMINDTLHKRVSSSIHFLKSPPAISFDEISIKEARNQGAKKIMVHDKESKIRYQCSFDEFEDKCISIDRGHGKQKALPMSYWETLDPNQMRMFN